MEIMETLSLESLTEMSPGLKPAAHALLNSEQRGFLERLDKFEAPYLEEKLIGEGKFSSKGEYQEAFTEFKKFSALNIFYPNKRIGMPSEKVDEVWHQFILFTQKYNGFCEEFLGYFLHHSPHISSTPKSRKLEGAINFARTYQDIFGEIPSIWKNGKYDFSQVGSSGCDGCDTSGPSGGCSTGCDKSED